MSRNHDTLRPDGSSPEGVYDATTWERTQGRQGRFNNSTTVKVRKTSGGFYWDAQIPGAVAGVQVSIFSFVQSLGDYFIAKDSSGKKVAIAKTYKLRNSILTETIYGNVINFKYPHNPHGGGPSSDPLAYLYRTASLTGGGSENQGVVPQYLVNDVIYALQCDTGVMSDPLDTVISVGGKSVDVNWIQIASAQAWCRFSDQTF